ncbi:unnamed protein product [Rotaria sp. Silwood1]|nr:unnamed protein product [Rotaria sp. Silwood1]
MSNPAQIKHPIEIRSTKPFADQKPGTSGLRKLTKTFKANQYFENFIQAYFDDLAETMNGKLPTLVVGGDGRHFVREGTRIIIQMAAANNVKSQQKQTIKTANLDNEYYINMNSNFFLCG